MAVTIPGLSLSIMRQETTVRAGRPLLMSGRFTALGLGIPALIRVYLEGPSYDPQVRHFDTFASPFTGDYTTNIIAEKDGRYTVYAQAFPPPMIPTGPPFPEAILLLPPLAESTRPPLGVGIPVEGGVDALLPDGTRQFIPTPPQQPIEISPYITVAPGITVTAPGVPTVGVPYAPPPPPPPAPPPVAPPVAPPEVSATIEDIRFEPSVMLPGQTAIGLMSWRNTGDTVRTFDIAFYLIDMVGVRYGPLQLEQNVRVAPLVPAATALHLGTEGLPVGGYSVVADVYDVETGRQITSRTFPARLELQEVPVPPVPPPPPPPPPVVPELPTPETVGLPSITMPRQLTVGQVWSGTASVPTYGAIPYYYDARLSLADPQGIETVIGRASRSLAPGEALEIPVSYNTTGLTPGDYSIIVRVFDQAGTMLGAFPIGFLSLIEAVVPPPVPVPPVAPALPTADMFQIPIIDLPTEVTLGETWAGSIRVPTAWPAALPQPPTLPPYPVNIGVDLESPTGVRFDVADFSRSFVPGETIDLPLSFDTGPPMEPGLHNIILTITDLQGNQLFENVIGFLRVLAAAIPPPAPPPVPIPSEFPSISVEMGLQEVMVGDEVEVPFTYTHLGRSEVVLAYAAIGNEVPGGAFDEIWHGQKNISVPDDPVPTTHRDSITITITPKLLAAGIYDVYAKINTFVPKVISPTVPNIVRVLEVPAPPPVLPRADIADYDFQVVTIGPFNPGDTVSWIATGVYKGRAQGGSLTISLGIGSFAPIITRFTLPTIPVSFEQSTDWAPFTFRGNFTIPVGVEPGLTYSIRARLETFIEPTQETDHDFNVISITAAPPPPPPPPALPRSEFTSISIGSEMRMVYRGDTLGVLIRYTHQGEAESEWLYAAIGNVGVFGFDEILSGRKAISVPDDREPVERVDMVEIPITTAISPGIYDLYAKVGLVGVPRAITPTQRDVVRVIS